MPIQPRRNRRGVMLPLIAFLLPMMLVFLGFAVDLAYMQSTRLELRATTDAAARAAATKLSQTDSTNKARTAAKDIALANSVAGVGLKLADSDVVFGRSAPNNNDEFVFVAGKTPYNAVRVTGDRRTGSETGAVGLLLGKLHSTMSFEPVATSTASFLNIDVCLVLDRSTSMKADVTATSSGMYTTDPLFCKPPQANTRWLALDAATKVFTDVYRDTMATEQVALVTYNSSFKPAIYCGTSTSASSLDLGLTSDLDAVDSVVSNRSVSVWNGNTDIESGIRTGMNELLKSKSARSAADRILIVMTDGNENVGSAVDAAEDCYDKEIQVHAITFSVEANTTTMKKVAEAGGGKHIHANTEAELKAAFEEIAAISAQLTE